MESRIQQLKSTSFYGQRSTRRHLAEIQQTVVTCSRWNRRELAHAICEHLQWHTAGGEVQVPDTIENNLYNTSIWNKQAGTQFVVAVQ